jgi:hypothetical protein
MFCAIKHVTRPAITSRNATMREIIEVGFTAYSTPFLQI